MLLANRQFNHDTESFHESIGIADATRIKCRERVFFTAFTNALQREELFEDEDDVPKSMRTVSGDLQRCLQSITDQLEYEYTLMIFNTYQRMAMESIALYKHMQESQSKEDRVKLKILELIEEIRNKDKDDEEEEEAPIDVLSKKTMLKRIGFIKSSLYNFDTYMNMLNKFFSANTNDFTEKKPDIDDLLRNLFSKDED